MFLKRYKERGTIARKEGSGLPPKLSTAALEVIDTAMKEDDELTATQLQSGNVLIRFVFLCRRNFVYSKMVFPFTSILKN